MRLFTKTFISLALLINIAGCGDNETDDTEARKNPQSIEGQPAPSTTASTYIGPMTTITDMWPGRNCPSLTPTGDLGAAILSIDFLNRRFNLTTPENVTIPGFNAAFTQDESSFSNFGRSFRSALVAADSFGDFDPQNPIVCTYENVATLVVDGELSSDLSSLVNTTYQLFASCGIDMNGIVLPPFLLCSGQINGTLQ